MAAPTTTVLVADDETALLDLATRVLRRQGHRVLPATSGEEAIRVFESSLEPIHVVILDLCLPDVDGVTVLRRLRTLRPNLGVVFASGHEKDELPEDLRTDDRVSFLQKPFRGRDLVEAVSSLLDGTRSDSSSLSSPMGRRSVPVASSGGCP